jgi:hypothetical protein
VERERGTGTGTGRDRDREKKRIRVPEELLDWRGPNIRGIREIQSRALVLALNSVKRRVY